MKYTDALADQHDQFLDVQWEKARLLGMSTHSTGIDWSIT